MLFHVGEKSGDAQVVIALPRVFKHRVLGTVANLLDDLFRRELGFGQIVRGDVGGPLRFGRIRRKRDNLDAAFDRPVDRLDERIGLHRVQQNAGRLLHQVLLKRCNLLGDVIIGRTRKCRFAAHGCRCLLEPLVDGNPVGMSRNHHVHDIGFTRLALELALR